MKLLDKIVKHKIKEVDEKKELYPEKLLERSILFSTPAVSLKKYLSRKDKVGVIAEIKRKSPINGELNMTISVEQISIGYMQAGASALSVLTDQTYFGGENSDLITARKFNFCPILRKDFILDKYQIIEARSFGADVILLIAAVLTPAQTKALAKFAKSIDLEVLLEIHEKSEVPFINQYVDVVGVNNRNLNDMTVDIGNSLKLKKYLPKDILTISESGISSAETIIKLKNAYYNGFLIGECFMSTSDPAAACKKLIRETRLLINSK